MSIIFHVDMDSFFASCEIARKPELKDKPVIIGKDPKKGRGVVMTCNYIARTFGVHSAQPITTAYKLCPKGIYLPGDKEYYRNISKEVMEILKSYSKKFEKASIDEAYLDMTKIVLDYNKAKELAEKIQKKIQNNLNMTCSIGIAQNKPTAKIASDMKKPNGITIITPERIKETLHPLSIKKISGIGPKTNAILENEGIKTIEDIYNTPIETLTKLCGKFGNTLAKIADGTENSPVNEKEKNHSVSRATTFPYDITKEEEIEKEIENLAKKISKRLKKEKKVAKTFGIKLKYSNFDTISRMSTYYYPTSEQEVILTTTKELFKKHLEKDKAIRLVGVTAYNLSKKETRQMTLELFQ